MVERVSRAMFCRLIWENSQANRQCRVLAVDRTVSRAKYMHVSWMSLYVPADVSLPLSECVCVLYVSLHLIVLEYLECV